MKLSVNKAAFMNGSYGHMEILSFNYGMQEDNMHYFTVCVIGIQITLCWGHWRYGDA